MYAAPLADHIHAAILQASPHVAGELAYFLSLYPGSFDVETGDFLGHAKSDASYLRQGAQIVFDTVQAWAGYESTAPIPAELSPKALKNAMIRLATAGALTVRSSLALFRT